jgi:hypothetical protein
MAGAPKKSEVDITEAMLDAGYEVLVRSGVTEYPLEADRLVVREIYASMRRLEPGTAAQPADAPRK